MDIIIDKSADLPVYQQIVNAINEQIRMGNLNPGDKLPTVRDLSATTGLSKGTIKHAYDELGKGGIIQMTQGRGTFVLGRKEPETVSKKNRAMQAIDQLLNELEEMGFSSRDIEIYLNLKMREREERYDKVRVAVVDCNPETLSVIVNQIYQIANVEVVQYNLNNIIQNPHRLDDTFDVIVTTTTHYDLLAEQISSLRDMIVKVATSPPQQTILQLAEIPPGSKTGIWCSSQVFANIVRSICSGIPNVGDNIAQMLETDDPRLFAQYLEGKDVILVAPNYLSITSSDNLALLKNFQSRAGRVVVVEYQIDRGSFVHLEDYIKKLWVGKRI